MKQTPLTLDLTLRLGSANLTVSRLRDALSATYLTHSERVELAHELDDATAKQWALRYRLAHVEGRPGPECGFIVLGEPRAHILSYIATADGVDHNAFRVARELRIDLDRVIGYFEDLCVMGVAMRVFPSVYRYVCRKPTRHFRLKRHT